MSIKRPYPQGLSLITQYCDICPKEVHLIWKLPVYRFIIPYNLNPDGDSRYKDILIDVTDSAPPFNETKKQMAMVFDEGCKLLTKESPILDFGAGKLRNTIYFLEKGYNVNAVEFEKLENLLTKQKNCIIKH